MQIPCSALFPFNYFLPRLANFIASLPQGWLHPSITPNRCFSCQNFREFLFRARHKPYADIIIDMVMKHGKNARVNNISYTNKMLYMWKGLWENISRGLQHAPLPHPALMFLCPWRWVFFFQCYNWQTIVLSVHEKFSVSWQLKYPLEVNDWCNHLWKYQKSQNSKVSCTRAKILAHLELVVVQVSLQWCESCAAVVCC